MLHQLGSLVYSPPLESHIRQLKPIPSGSNWEIELRGTSIWCVELIRQEIMRRHPETRVQTTASIAEKDDDVHMDESQEEKTSDSQEGKSESPPQSPSPSAPPSSSFNVNAILIDFFLYDTMKELEAKGAESIPHHRTRSIWY